jgi:hypothetical protein
LPPRRVGDASGWERGSSISRAGRLLEFLDDALAGGRSVTVHAFIARAHGNDPRSASSPRASRSARCSASSIGEALAAAAFLGPMLKANPVLAALLSWRRCCR